MKKYTDEDVNEFIKQMKEFEKTVIPEHLRGNKMIGIRKKLNSFKNGLIRKLKIHKF